MNIFPAITFFHVTGAIAIFISWALEYNHLASLRKSLTTNNEDLTSKQLKGYKKIGSFGVLVTLTTGIWLMIAIWGYSSWIMMAVISILLIIITEVFFSRKATSSKTDKVQNMLYQISSIRLRIAIGTGIVALMVFKTSHLLPSLLIVLIFLIAGFGIIWFFPPFKKQI